MIFEKSASMIFLIAYKKYPNIIRGEILQKKSSVMLLIIYNKTIMFFAQNTRILCQNNTQKKSSSNVFFRLKFVEGYGNGDAKYE